MSTNQTWRERFRHYHEQHERKLEAIFFCAGFIFDIIATAEGVDHMLMIVQQIIYLFLIGVILYVDTLREAYPTDHFSPRLERLWSYRGLLLHFCLGTLMNIYSIFFLMSASFFSSIVFVLLLFAALILNEMKAVRARGVDVKVALYVICLFCFFSLMMPLAFGRVGLLPFFCSFLATLAVVFLFFKRLRKRMGPEGLRRKILVPGLSVCVIFLGLYLAGLIPPVPLSAKKLGVYHAIEKEGDDYVLHHERPWWKFWQRGDQNFVARPGDRIYFFAAISSPARFADTVYVHWYFHDARHGWNPTDRIPLRISGGRKEGFRGFTTKQNFDYGDGSWRVSVETEDEREIGRMYFDVTKAESDPNRVFQAERY
ncbi:MAG TPA: DUF2914 domain-containing protein [Bdellovibrionota bacterium]|jgi:hypothetical protein